MLVLAGVVGAAAPAEAQTIISRTPSGTLHDGNLHGMEIHFALPTGIVVSGQQYTSRYRVQGAPSGANVWVSWADNAPFGSNVPGIARSRRGNLRVGFSGDFTADWQLTIRLSGGGIGSYFGGASHYDFGPITIRARPKSTLRLSPASISENGGFSTVTVRAAAVPPAVASDFTLSANWRLTFAANATTSSGTVTITRGPGTTR